MFRRMLLVHCQEEFTKDVNALIQAVKVHLQHSLHYRFSCCTMLYAVLHTMLCYSSSNHAIR
jgi:hypothetical protein